MQFTFVVLRQRKWTRSCYSSNIIGSKEDWKQTAANEITEKKKIASFEKVSQEI